MPIFALSALTSSTQAPSSPPTTALLSPRKQAALEASPVMQLQSPQATEGAQANWTRKKSVLTPIPPAELLAAMAAQVRRSYRCCAVISYRFLLAHVRACINLCSLTMT